ncbi:MAG TPA: amylo-alpha-1,6-glucosidase, partial [Sedimentisphaerales bacterium]|nr:amylo-alpha-1,6-glucosidase [Sedimentisphaerales bacterium]
FVGLRDFHSLQKSYAPLKAVDFKHGLLIRHDVRDSCELFLNCPDAKFEHDPQWWFNFVYRRDKWRGQDYKEDLASEGFYRVSIDSPRRVVFWATLANSGEISEEKINLNFDIDSVRSDITKRQKSLIAKAKAKNRDMVRLALAADQMVIYCPSKKNCRTTILAGYPWFADWGRDAFISLPGLLLETGRFEEAKSVLTYFANSCEKGVIPNRFDDRGDTAYFNTVDASLWFIDASFKYFKYSGDEEGFSFQLLPVIRNIVDCYQKGTMFNIHSDTDGLITAGDADTQLTWMDAKFDNVVFTPRYGKAVEINALWYNALCSLAEFYAERDVETAKYYHEMADVVNVGFNQKYWNSNLGCLNDCIAPNGTVDSSIRPNQIYAVSLSFSPLSLNRQRQVVQIVQDRLLTPFGLRTLDRADSRYIGVYAGPQEKRDRAYHQGTVWPYLIGGFVEAYLKVNDFSKQSKAEAAEFIRPLLENIGNEGCLGSVAEIYDGDEPQAPKGCIAQAWSVAELLRAYKLIHG